MISFKFYTKWYAKQPEILHLYGRKKNYNKILIFSQRNPEQAMMFLLKKTTQILQNQILPYDDTLPNFLWIKLQSSQNPSSKMPSAFSGTKGEIRFIKKAIIKLSWQESGLHAWLLNTTRATIRTAIAKWIKVCWNNESLPGS